MWELLRTLHAHPTRRIYHRIVQVDTYYEIAQARPLEPEDVLEMRFIPAQLFDVVERDVSALGRSQLL